MRNFCLILLLSGFLLSACAVQAGTNPPELLIPVSVQNDIFTVERGRVARFEQYRAIVRVESEGLFFRETPLPFGSFEVIAGQEVRQGDLLARLDTSRIEERIDERRERINDLQAEHRILNEQREIAISMAQVELLALRQGITESPESYLLEAADLQQLEIQRLQMDLQQAREWQAFSLSYYQSDLNEMISQLPDAELRAPFDGVVIYRASIYQGTWIDAFSPIIYLSDRQNLFVEYAGPTTPSIFRTSAVRAQIGDNSFELERIILPPSEILFFTRAGGMAPFRFAFIDEPDADVNPGQFVQLMVYSSEREDVLRVPPNSLFFDAEIGSYVNLVEANGQRVVQPVEIGLRTPAWAEVLAGLVEGDEIIVQQ